MLAAVMRVDVAVDRGMQIISGNQAVVKLSSPAVFRDLMTAMTSAPSS